MNKILIIGLSILSIAVSAQQKPKLAVYMTGDDPINEIVSNRLVDDFARSNEYTTVERTASFLAELSKEHNYERSGEVDDEQIAALGKQFNVQYVCVASVLDVWDEEKYITARIIDAETAEVVASGSSNGSIKNSSELIGAMNSLSSNFLKAMRYNKQSDAKKVAVYVIKSGNRDVDIVLGDQLVAGFARSGRYAAIERTNGFLRKIKEEQGYQQSGAVEDEDLTRLGQQFGVQYVCIVKTTSWAGDYFITTRMIDVKTGGVVNSYKVEGRRLGNSKDVVIVSQEMAAELSKGTFEEQAEEKRQEAIRREQERQKQIEEQRLAEQRRVEAEQRKKQELIDKPWQDLLKTITAYSHVNKSSDGKVCRIGNCYNGFGIKFWLSDNELLCGNFTEGNMDGSGMRVAPSGSSIWGCPDSWVFVGQFHKGNKKYGRLYNRQGKTIYWDSFIADKPVKKYPNSWTLYTFHVINFDNGDKYIGEMKEGKKSGKGLYIWARGTAWYGSWENDTRNGYGMLVTPSGTSTGTWKDGIQQ